MKRRLGRQETQMLAYLQMRQKGTVRTGELTGPLGLTREQAASAVRFSLGRDTTEEDVDRTVVHLVQIVAALGG